MIKKPDWLRVPYYSDQSSSYITEMLDEMNLNTVCVEASCPNRSECFSNKTATFMVLGTNCTRKCMFCNVSFGIPQPIDRDEPSRIARAVKKLNLSYVVITSVTRDDLPDGGADHFANVIQAVHELSPKTAIEVLIPDLSDIIGIVNKSPTVISHNIETVKSLYEKVRPAADYFRSLSLIKKVKSLDANIRTKSGIMLGLGETRDEVLKTLDDLLEAECEFLTIGQYLAPSKNHYPVSEYIEPQVFTEYADIAYKKGFIFVASAPFVRSSYHADKALLSSDVKGHQ